MMRHIKDYQLFEQEKKQNVLISASKIKKKYPNKKFACVDFVEKVIEDVIGEELDTKTSNKIKCNLGTTDPIEMYDIIKKKDNRTKGVQLALTSSNLGIAIPYKNVIKGDFVQFWRMNTKKDKKRIEFKDLNLYKNKDITLYKFVDDTDDFGKDVKISFEQAKETDELYIDYVKKYVSFGHSAIVSHIENNIIYLIGSGEMNGYAGKKFGKDNSYNRIPISELKNNKTIAYFARLK